MSDDTEDNSVTGILSALATLEPIELDPDLLEEPDKLYDKELKALLAKPPRG